MSASVDINNRDQSIHRIGFNAAKDQTQNHDMKADNTLTIDSTK